ncbi:MAG: hypothetical protein CVT99_08580 [Bacteroidetes bacterium HGW-Bacteroidetes-16]|jgi:hypothetical protein|nr:MAG: hypothetical protein CVT99_08580 [Bacteroidetes bacterium HGW-Bacteroidetes-16]
MKKVFFVVLSLCTSISIHAQVNQLKSQPRLNKITEKAVVSNQDPVAVTNEINPYTSVDRGPSIVIGETFYDLQSNSSMAQRFWEFDDGTMASTWTMGMTPPDYADRGTGYNYFDGTSWGPIPIERIENVRTGWPNYAPYGANGELVCAHTFTNDGLVFSWRTNKGEGDWNYFSLIGPPAHEDISWPRMMTSGENHEIIHVIYLTKGTGNGGTVYEGLNGALLYSRSADGGLTWNPQHQIIDGLGSDYTSGWSADDYAFAASRGDNLAFIAFGGITDGVAMKSIDGGDNWERILFYQSPDPFFDGNGGNLPQCGGGDGYNAIVMDDEGMVHVAFGRQIHLDDTPDDANWSYFPYSDGLVYWNEDMEVLDTTKISNEVIPEDWTQHYLYLHGNLAAYTQGHGIDTIVGVSYYGASLTSMPQLVFYRDFLTNQKIIQVDYSAVSIGYDNSELNFRHIWQSCCLVGEYYWGGFTDYTGDVFHIFSESVFPAASQNIVNDRYALIYQEDNMPGTSISPDPPTHDPILTSIVYLNMWRCYITGEDELSNNLFQISQNYPNPFNGSTYIEINLSSPSDILLEVCNLTGQKVMVVDYGYKTAGKQTLTLEASQLVQGVYFYTVTARENKITRKMLVE